MAQVIDVFIASPNDVKDERKYAEDVIHLVSSRTKDVLDIALHTVNWTNFLPAANRSPNEHVQDRFSNRVKKCGIFVGLLFERYGTEINEVRKISGTEEEFQQAILNRERIEILTYFRRPQSIETTDQKKVAQLAKLQELKDRLLKNGILKHEYDGPGDFRERFIFDLFETVINIRTEAERKRQVQSFFKFGINSKRFSPSVMLAYPPIHKHVQEAILSGETKKGYQQIRPHKYNWQERLLPNVVYEDMKCIQKIETAVRLSGVQDISSVTIDHPSLQTDPGNRIWLCLPRNSIAQRQRAQLHEKARFQFIKKENEKRPYIIWKDDERKNIEIGSPLEKYMIFQKRPPKTYWKPEYGSIVARDYAIIARFTMDNTKGLTRDVPYYHYFIAGIRGLGTWGAGWFISRRPDELYELTKIAEEKGTDPQILLEVTFSNYRIIDTKVVNNHKQNYFTEQLSDDKIRSVIEKYR